MLKPLANLFVTIVFLQFSFSSATLDAQTNMKTPQVLVNAPPDGCAPVLVSFINNSHAYYDTTKIIFKWFADQEVNPFYVGYNPPDKSFNGGYHNVKIVADSAGFSLGTAFREFSLKSKPTRFLPENNTQFCPGEEVVFRIEDNVTDITWDYGDGLVFDGSNHNNWAPHVYKSTGSYNVKVLYNSQCGSDSIKQTIVISPTAVPTVHAYIKGDWNACINDAVTFETSEKYVEYMWNFGDGTSSIAPRPTHAYSVVKNFAIILTAKNSCGSTGVDTVFVNVGNDRPAYAGFNYWFQGNSCPNTPVNFSANSSGRYQWSFGDGGVSELREPTNVFSDTGRYKVRLVVVNGCGRSDTSYNFIDVKTNNSNLPPFPNIELFSAFEKNQYDQNNNDTLKVCPGEKILFKNSNWNDGSKYTWELGDGTKYYGQSGEHMYTNPGVYTVKLTLTNNCMASVTATKVVKIDNNLKPLVNLKAVPREICPGEKVFFFDDGNDSENPKHKYSLFFGDGTSLTEITNSTDTVFKTLATHAYPNAGVYNFKFVATNTCGNKDSIFGPISVNTNPKIPFYFIENSTTMKSDGMEDWSVRKMPFDSKFVIPVRWDAWPGIDTTLTAYFWWGQFDPANPDNSGDPAGFVNIKVKNIINNGVDTIIAYVPYDLTRADSVGMVVAWYCNHQMSDGMPEAFVTPLKSGFPVKSIKVIPSGIVDFATLYAPGIVFPDTSFKGKCNTSVKGKWSFKNAENNFYLLELYDGQYQVVQSPQPDFNSMHNPVSNGNYNVKNDTITFEDPNCGSLASYKFLVSGNNLDLILITDDCAGRKNALTNKQYVHINSNEKEGDRSGCPGDKVKFMLAGGQSCQWFFGDGSPSVTGNVVYHVYPNIGTYIAKAVTTSGCNRTDTIRTIVRIGNTNLPGTGFDMDKYWAVKGDTIHFNYWGNGGRGDDIDNNTYKWEFGDATSSLLRNPFHVYQQKGRYEVKLNITNGCGSTFASRPVEIGGSFDNCNLLAKFAVLKSDTTKLQPGVPISFQNYSSGKFTKYSWNFGDGSVDTSLNPIHIFNKSGKYNVCLSIFDVATNCSDQICMEILVGIAPCEADFSFVTNNTTNTLQLFDKSYKATKWLWKFSDGKYDTLANTVRQFAKPGSYEVCLSTYDKMSNCQAQKCMVIAVGQIDSASYCKAEYSYFVDNTNMEVRFKNESVGTISKGYWNFNDGYFSNEENPVHKYAKPGLYKVCANIIDSSGCQSGICKDIQVGILPCKADFNFFIDLVNKEVKFTPNDLGNNLKYYWDFGDGRSSVSKETTNKYSTNGTYSVCHFIQDTVTGCKSDKCLEIPIGETLCRAEFTYMIGEEKKVNFALASDTSLKKQWDFGDGKIDYTANPVHQYTQDGIYKVCLNVYNPTTSCMASKCLNIVINSTSNNLMDADFAYIVDPVSLKTQFNDKSIGRIRRYYWNFGDGTSDTVQNPTHIYLKPGAYKVCQLVSDSAKNVSEECREIFVKEVLCKTNFSFYIKPGDLSVQLNDMSSGSIKEHYWDFGNGFFSNKKDALVTYPKEGTYKVCKSIIDSANCKASVCKEIQVGSLNCISNFNYFVDVASNTVKFTDQSIGVDKYFWDFGDGSFSNLKDPSHSYLKPGLYKITQMVKNSVSNCSNSIIKEIQVGILNCEADFNYLVDAASRTVSLQSISKGEIKRYYWESGAGVSDTTENTKFTYTSDGSYSVCLHVLNPATNCRANICKTIAIIQDTSKLERFASDFTYFVVIDSNKVVLNDNSSGSPSHYYWTFGDGNFEKSKDASHIYSNGGSYKICHSIFKSATGQFHETCKEINIGSNLCNVIAGFSMFVDAKTQTVYLKDNSKGSVNKWFWRFGDGTTSQNANPVHTFIKPGYQLISLAVRDTVKGCTDVYTEMVKIGDVTCKAGFEYMVDMSVNELSLKNTSTGNIQKYYWDFGDRKFSVETAPVHTYDEAGLYRVLLVAGSEDASCKDYYAQSIQVGTINCSADFEYYVDSATNVVYFKNKALGVSTRYLWLFGDGSISDQANPTHKYQFPGYYKVGLNTFNPINGCMDHYENVILVGSEGIDCQADFFFQVDDNSKTVNFYNKSNGNIVKYLWNFGDRTAPDLTSDPVHIYNVGGYYNVCLTVYTADGIQNTMCKVLKISTDVNSDCFVDFAFNIDSLNKTVNFADKSTGGQDKWLWDFGDGNTSELQNPEHVYAQPGYYNVKLLAKSITTGCTRGVAKLLNVAEAEVLKASYIFGLDTAKLKSTGNYPVTFSGLSTGDAAKYVWDFGDGSKDSTTNSPTHVYTTAGTYNVCLTVSDPVTTQSNKYCSQIVAGTLGVYSISDEAPILKAYPSPFTESFTIEFGLVESGKYELVLTDVSGQKLKTIDSGNKPAGLYSIRENTLDIANGIYYVQLKLKNRVVKTITMVKVN